MPTAEPTSGDTRQRLLLAALRLYAKNGLYAVSLRSINTAAGSKNSAAMHYHFNNKLGVVQALVEMIAHQLQSTAANIHRRSGTAGSLREAFGNTLRPLSMLPAQHRWGVDALRFMSMVMGSTDPDISAVINPVYQPFWERVDRDLAVHLPDLPEDVRRLRLMFMSVNVFHGIAEVASLAHTPLGDMSHFDNASLLEHLVDYLIGGLKAPHHLALKPTGGRTYE